jgi:hypothetical protein
MAERRILRKLTVHVVASSAPNWQLPKYIESMGDAGLQEAFLPRLADNRDGRLWRKVPRRKCYSQKRGETPGTQEVVLFFKKATEVADTTSYKAPLTSLAATQAPPMLR